MDLIQIMQEWLLGLMGDYTHSTLVTDLILILLTILVFWLLYKLVFRGFRALSRRVLKEDSQVQPLRIQKQEILSAQEMALILNRTLLGV
ncbi:MAG: hypothetical protein QNK34_13705 [Woeseiaceae bacterium]|nr:hypothetical protein [Woeseiaceae bacterium]